MRMNRLTAWSAVLLLSLTLAACGGGSSSTSQPSGSAAQTESGTAAQDPEALAADSLAHTLGGTLTRFDTLQANPPPEPVWLR